MIHLEYDVPLAGMRVSFVVCDSAMSCSLPGGEFEEVRNVKDTKHAPQNRNNLAKVAKLLEAVIKQS